MAELETPPPTRFCQCVQLVADRLPFRDRRMNAPRMSAPRRIRIYGACGAKAAALLVLVGLTACGGGILRRQPAAPAPPPPPPSLAARPPAPPSPPGARAAAPPPSAPGPAFALQGTIAPEGGCPRNLFPSRKW